VQWEKKIASEMEKQRDVFVKGAAKKNIKKEKANEIFDLIDKFSGYGFNKSHSVAYAYISYQTAWLKAHYPAAFMASVLSDKMDDTDKIAFTIGEVQNMGLIVNGPNVCESDYEFSIKDDKTIVYGLGAIKGVGEALVQTLVAEREAGGEYKDLFEFCARIEKKSLNKRAIEALIYSGAFDVFGVDRASLLKTYPKAVKQAEQRQNDQTNGQNTLFNSIQEHAEYELSYDPCPRFSFKERLKLEKSVMGYYFYDHPTDEYKDDLKRIGVTLPKDTVLRNNKEVRVLALISELRYITTRSGDQMASIIIEDGSTKLSAVIFPRALGPLSDKLIANEIVVISAKIKKNKNLVMSISSSLMKLTVLIVSLKVLRLNLRLNIKHCLISCLMCCMNITVSVRSNFYINTTILRVNCYFHRVILYHLSSNLAKNWMTY
jgi:DNA polymerase-3 subunit alpha